jgi:hypothetical protein
MWGNRDTEAGRRSKWVDEVHSRVGGVRVGVLWKMISILQSCGP